MRSAQRGRLSPLALVAALVAGGGIGAGIFAVRGQNTNPQLSSSNSTAVAALTQLVPLQTQAVAHQTEISELQRTIAQLRQTAIIVQTPTPQPPGTHGYLASFQVDRYSYILYLQWTESNGFIRDGRLLTTDNYAPKASRQYGFTGSDNNGTYSFNLSIGGVSTTFSGSVNNGNTLSVSGLPWSVFAGFVGGTFAQTMHAGTLPAYNAYVASLPPLPR